MGSFQWYLTKKREALAALMVDIAKREGKSGGQIIEEALEEYVRKKANTHNPQTMLKDYDDPGFQALPNIWSINLPKDLKEFSSETIKEVISQCERVEHMGRKRLEARGE